MSNWGKHFRFSISLEENRGVTASPLPEGERSSRYVSKGAATGEQGVGETSNLDFNEGREKMVDQEF